MAAKHELDSALREKFAHGMRVVDEPLLIHSFSRVTEQLAQDGKKRNVGDYDDWRVLARLLQISIQPCHLFVINPPKVTGGRAGIVTNGIEQNDVPSIMVKTAPRSALSVAVGESAFTLFCFVRAEKRITSPAADVMVSDGVVGGEFELLPAFVEQIPFHLDPFPRGLE